MHGAPVVEIEDTILRGINKSSGKIDFDLYPLTLNRDTTIVLRSWWLISFYENEMLYVVFDIESNKPIYGYQYNPLNIPI